MSTQVAQAGTLSGFAAAALDWPAIRALIRRHAPSALGQRAVDELVPRDDEDARRALLRLREMGESLERGAYPPLRGYPDPLPALEDAKAYSRALGGEDVDAVGRLLRVVDETATWLAARAEAAPESAELLRNRADTTALRGEIERSVDEKGEVLDGASQTLKRLREEIKRLQRDIERRVRVLANQPRIRNVLAEGSAGQVHRRGGRPVLAVRAKSRGHVPGIVHDSSQSGETVFVEPEEVVEAGNRLATARSDEKREVGRILTELTRAVLARLDVLRWLGARLAQLELAVAGASWAREVGGRAARLPGEEGAASGLVLRGMRHPLLIDEERAGRIERAVPIDLRLGDDFDMIVMTGPNTGGKTLALKSAGVAVLLTRLGLPLPFDEGSTVPLWDGVVADIGDEQEIQQSLSTFSSHLVRIQAGLERAGERTLVLLDELGGGTDPAEGAALGEAILTALLRRRVPTIASTHLGQLKEFAFLNARVENGSVEFDLETLAPLYRVLVGTPGESHALAIARRLGLPSEVLEQAESRLDRSADESHALLEGLRHARVDTERLRSTAEDRLVEVEARLAEAERERDELAQRKEQLEAEAQRGVEERVSDTRPHLEQARALLSRLPGEHKKALGEIVAGLEASLEGATLSDRRKEFLRSLKKGDVVWLPRYKKRCIVARIKKDKRQVLVRLGRQELTVAFDDVTFYESL
ncbi:MAG: hypothetical protein AAF682_31075 [Planctomycetota bacterium]